MLFDYIESSIKYFFLYIIYLAIYLFIFTKKVDYILCDYTETSITKDIYPFFDRHESLRKIERDKKKVNKS